MRGALLLALMLALVLDLPAASPRMDRVLTGGWRFSTQDDPAFADPATSHDAWLPVTLPHTWNAADGRDGGDDYHRAPAWYRLRLPVEAELAGKSFFLRFESATTVATVYLNGARIGEHRGGYAAFCFDVTQAIRPGEENLLAVRVSNAPDPDIAPLGGDFTIFGGITRPVHLLVLDPLSVSPLDHGSPGVRWRQTKASAETAEIAATVRVRNGYTVERNASVRFFLVDAEGAVVHDSVQRVTIPPRSEMDLSEPLTIQSPRLWNGLADPHRYRAAVEVLEGDALRDRVEQRIGLRFFQVDPNRGFFLNGQPYRLRGVSRHQDRPDKGAAVGLVEHREDIELILAMGANAVRPTSHQHAEEFYELCDEVGLVASGELPLANDMTPGRAFMDNARQQLTELIRQNEHHPSICFWYLFNELGNRVEQPIDYAPRVAELNALAHQLDPTRLTCGATDDFHLEALNRTPDLIGFNKYPGWYGSRAERWPRLLDEFRAGYPEQRLAVSEYGAGGSIAQHEWPPVKPEHRETWHPEEYQAHVHEIAWGAMKERPWLWGTFAWNGFEFASDRRIDGEQPGVNDKGLVTYDRRTKKDAYFFYQANWTTEPMVYITRRRHNVREPGPAPVKIYSNCERVELLLNGDSLGERTRDDLRRIEWEAVPLKDGLNHLVARAASSDRTISDEITWLCTR